MIDIKYLFLPNGNVFSCKNSRKKIRKVSKIMKPTIDKDGYLYYKLTINGIQKFNFGHRIVALNYIDNPENKKTVNHKDGNKKNNNFSNLEWNTHSENEFHSYRVLGKKPNLNRLGKTGKETHNSIKIIAVDENGNDLTNLQFDSCELAGKAMGFTTGKSISRAIRENRKSGNLNWRKLHV